MAMCLFHIITPGPCQFPQHLDEALLQQHHLLTPSNYLITSRPPVTAPQRQFKLFTACTVDVKCLSCSTVHAQLSQAHIHVGPTLKGHI